MDEKTAGKLLDDLRWHFLHFKPDREMFLDILVSTDIPESPVFYTPLPEKKQLVQESNRYHYLSLSGVLMNRNTEANRLSYGKYMREVIRNRTDPREVLKVRRDKDLLKMMADCSYDYSLMGKFQTYDFDNPEQKLMIKTQPLLVIPNESRSIPVVDWEIANTIYEQETGMLFRHNKRISAGEYFSI
jgi:hypothetical protein